MRIFSDLYTGIVSYKKAAGLIFSSWMWLAFLVPIALSIAIYLGGESLTESLKNYDFRKIDDDSGSDYLLVGIQSILVYVAVYMNKYMVLALLAPLLAALSTRTEYLLTGNKYPFVIKYYAEDIKRALIISFRNMGLQLFWMAIFMVVTFVYALPPIAYSIFYYFIAFYFYGFAFMDYANERRRLSVRESVKFTRRHFLAAFVLGGIYGGLFFIPDFGLMVAPGVVVAPIFGVVAGTVAVHRIADLSRNPHAIRQEEAEAVS